MFRYETFAETLKRSTRGPRRSAEHEDDVRAQNPHEMVAIFVLRAREDSGTLRAQALLRARRGIVARELNREERMHNFTPWSALAGGALIGLAASLLLVANGRIAGISGVLGGLLAPVRGDVAWRSFFVLGLLGAGLVASLVSPGAIGASPRSLPLLAVAGLLVGVGTRVGNGCTSGHGVCGISRLSPRSIVATVSFIAAGIAAVALSRALGVAS
jgi:hypothetical protein